MYPPEISKKRQLEDLNLKNLFRSKIVENLEEELRNEYKYSRAKREEPFSFQKYQPLDKIYKWMIDLSKLYESWVQVFTITKSYEGRRINMMKISIPNTNKISKPAVWIQAGLHGREWIAPATVTVLTQFVNNI